MTEEPTLSLFAGLRLRLRLSLTLILVSLSASACESKTAENGAGSSSQKADLRYDLGTSEKRASGPEIEEEDFFLRVSTPEQCATEGVLAPEKGWIRLAYPLTLKARSERSVPVGPFEFSLQDEQGHVFRPTLATCKPTFQHVELHEGQELQAHVVFDVPDGSASYELIFQPFLIGRKEISVRIRAPLPKKEGATDEQ